MSEIVNASTDLDIFESKIIELRLRRDKLIFHAFKSGERQKDIAMYAGLSDSTVKHIVAEQKAQGKI